jgi:hypothetical protein
MPMLTEDEWLRVAPRLTEALTLAKRRECRPGESALDARSAATSEVLDLFQAITGFRETSIHAIYHHRLGLYGPPCGKCGKPLRTPQARFCAMCDWERADHSPWSPGADDVTC